MSDTDNKFGVKYDQGKLQYDLNPPEAGYALASIFTMGATKYGRRNWEKGMEWSRLVGAIYRHFSAWLMGQRKDPESGKSHLWHVLCNVTMLVVYEIRNIGVDDIHTGNTVDMFSKDAKKIKG